MPAWLVPAAIAAGSALLGASGQAKANKDNIALARERMTFEDQQAARQMAFQKEMSSTAAQRSVADYKAAGLNPALAYGTTASSPSGASGSGASAEVRSVAEAGLSSGRQSAALLQSMSIAKQQANADLAVKQAQVAELGARAATSIEQGYLLHADRRLKLQQFAFLDAKQPADVRRAFAEALLAEYSTPAARADAAFSTRLGEWRPAMGLIGNSAGSLSRLIPRFR